ncbi:MAG: hypothetical protein WBD27_12970 [Pyrinomonadaceae bacterium]
MAQSRFDSSDQGKYVVRIDLVKVPFFDQKRKGQVISQVIY